MTLPTRWENEDVNEDEWIREGVPECMNEGLQFDWDLDRWKEWLDEWKNTQMDWMNDWLKESKRDGKKETERMIK